MRSWRDYTNPIKPNLLTITYLLERRNIMNVNDVKNVCVVGAGNMGHRIALLCAIYGYKTTCTDVVPEALKKESHCIIG